MVSPSNTNTWESPEPSDDYWAALEDAKHHHATSKTFSGRFLARYALEIGNIIKQNDYKSVLDLGCGKGVQYESTMPSTGKTIEEYWGVPIFKYDPAVPKFAKEPEGTFDLVVCTHTLGAIPIADLGWFIDRLYAYANKAVYVVERISQPKKDWTDMAERCPVGWTAVRWLDELSPRRPTNKTLYFNVVYPRPEGLLYGKFVVS